MILNQSRDRKWETNFFLKNPKYVKLDLHWLFLMVVLRIVKAVVAAASLIEKSPKDKKAFGCGFEYNRRCCPFIRQTGEENTSVWGEGVCYRHWIGVVSCGKQKIRYIHQLQNIRNRNILPEAVC